VAAPHWAGRYVSRAFSGSNPRLSMEFAARMSPKYQ